MAGKTGCRNLLVLHKVGDKVQLSSGLMSRRRSPSTSVLVRPMVGWSAWQLSVDVALVHGGIGIHNGRCPYTCPVQHFGHIVPHTAGTYYQHMLALKAGHDRPGPAALVYVLSNLPHHKIYLQPSHELHL